MDYDYEYEYYQYRHWEKNGFFHRAWGLPAIEWINGTKEWWVNGKRHRETPLGGSKGVGGLPAIEWANGDKEWYVNGKCHREHNLPAREFVNGDKQWWINGVNITAFRNKYLEARRIRAQKRIYFWIIPILYRPNSESAKRLAEKSWQATLKLIC